jgi:hypothetical protein
MGTVLTNGHTYREGSAIFPEDFAALVAVGQQIDLVLERHHVQLPGSPRIDHPKRAPKTSCCTLVVPDGMTFLADILSLVSAPSSSPALLM